MGGNESIETYNGISNEGEPLDPQPENKLIIYPNQINQYLYSLVCKVNPTFTPTNNTYGGVGILIGPSIVLTVGHNLYEKGQKRTSLKISNFLFNEIACNDVYVSKQYEVLVDTNNQITDDVVRNDWGLIFLPFALGHSITRLLNIDHMQELQVTSNNLYYFFDNNICALPSNEWSISIIGTHKNSEVRMSSCNAEMSNTQHENENETGKEEKVINSGSNGGELDYIVLDEDAKDGQPILFNTTGLLENEKKGDLKYRIITEKGNSGSIILLKLSQGYLFIGLHSGKGPDAKYLKQSHANNNKDNDKDRDRGRDSSIDNGKKCEYNQGCNILKKKQEIIKIIKERSKSNHREGRIKLTHYHVTLILDDTTSFNFLFRTVSCDKLINTASKILNLPKEGITLHENGRNMTITDIDQSQSALKYRLVINIELCGKMICEKIINTYDNKVKKQPDKKIKELNKYIIYLGIKLFNEIDCLKKTKIYRPLYKEAREYLLQKYTVSINYELQEKRNKLK